VYTFVQTANKWPKEAILLINGVFILFF